MEGCEIPISQWVRNYLNYFPKCEESREEKLIRFVASLLSIWVNRNKIVFRGSSPNPNWILSSIEENYGRCWKFEERKEGGITLARLNANGLGKSGFWSTSISGGSSPTCIQIDGAWKKQIKKGDVEWTTGTGWWSNHEGIVVLGNQHVLAASPL